MEIDKTELNAFTDYQFSPIDFRACIGKNSGISKSERDMSIFDGYRELIELCFNNIKNQKLTIDAIFYPFMYSCRHSTELLLKQIIRRLCLIIARKNSIDYKSIASENKVLYSHDLRKLVNTMFDCVKIDEEIEAVVKEFNDIDQLLSELYIDEKSDTYRYTFDKNSNEHLNDKVIVSLEIVYLKYKKITNKLLGFYDFLFRKIEEYETGTFTKKLSRKQIEEISILLPEKQLWVENSFLEIKKQICYKYNLSSNDFSKTLNIIKNHREFAANINTEIKFMNLSDSFLQKTANLIKICEAYENRSSFKNIKIPIIVTYENYFQLTREMFFEMDLRDILVIYSFVEIGKYDNYSEDLDFIYKHSEDLPQDENYLLPRCFGAHSYKFLINGLKKCGQISYLKTIEKYYNE